MHTIPFYKPCIGPEEINEVVATLKSGWLTTGPRTKQFEREFAAYLGHKHAVAVNSCTAALHLAIEALGLKPGQGVVVPTMTFAATAEVVRYMGARPLLADCRTADFNLDVADAERRDPRRPQRGPASRCHHACSLWRANRRCRRRPGPGPALPSQDRRRRGALLPGLLPRTGRGPPSRARAASQMADGRPRGRFQLLFLLREQAHHHRRRRHGLHSIR